MTTKVSSKRLLRYVQDTIPCITNKRMQDDADDLLFSLVSFYGSNGLSVDDLARAQTSRSRLSDLYMNKLATKTDREKLKKKAKSRAVARLSKPVKKIAKSNKKKKTTKRKY